MTEFFTDPSKPYPLQNLPDASVMARVCNGHVEVTTDKYAVGVYLEAECVFEDNGFTMLPGEKRMIKIYGECGEIAVSWLNRR